MTRATWTAADGTQLDLDVTLGKALDVLALKGSSLEEIRSYAAGLERTASRLYGSAAGRHVERCPCCKHPAAEAHTALVVYGVAYSRCPHCAHAFVREQPAGQALDERFEESDELAAGYTDAAGAEVRLREVVLPKLDWTLGVYRRHRGRDPARAVDVGAGGGHFVAGLRRAGIAAEGYELSRSARTFARDVFDIELRRDDFLAAADAADLLTFWGLLEYTPDPRRFLAAARRALDPERGLLVVEVPRFDCLGTAVQARFPETVARHLDPTSHVNCFSDVSLATALLASGFRPVAAWYFGMDAYELAVQLALRLGDHMLGPLLDLLLPLQQSLDEARFCDDLVVAAVPLT